MSSIELRTIKEAEYIAKETERLIKRDKALFKDFAVLVKSHAQADIVEKELKKKNIPSVKKVNTGFFEHPAIKNALAALRLVKNTEDEQAFVRLLKNVLPDYGIYKMKKELDSKLSDTIEFDELKKLNLAQKYKNPTILLVDGLLGQTAEPCILFDNPYKEIDNSSWALTGAKNRPSRKIHSLEPSQNKLNKHILNLKNKYDLIEKNETDYEKYMCDDAEIILTAFGSLARTVKAVVNSFREKGLKAGLFRPKTLYPFPYDALKKIASQSKAIIDIEMNLGQMLRDVKLGVLSDSKVYFIGKPTGNWLKKEEIIDSVENILKENYANI